MTIPTPWETLLLALAAYRTFRLLGYDTILNRPRELILRRAKEEVGKYRREVDVFFHCPWCLGWWMSLAWWGAWMIWPHPVTVIAVPFSISAFVGLVTKNLDP